MSTWIRSRNGIMSLTVSLVIVSSLAVLTAVASQGVSQRTTAAAFLIMSFVVFLIGGVLFAGRAFLNWKITEASSHLIWERGSVTAAVVMTILGLALLEDMLRAAGDSYLARLGSITYLVGAVVLITAETAYLSKHDWNYPQVVLYVMLAFLAQAAFGVALLQTGLVSSWAGWATVIWNLGCLFIMLVIRPRDVYYPVLHHVAPLIIGIALLAGS